ncbi:TPA: hypothetical protein DEB00_00110 [Candidatus Uhrbacteria bacterium]|nr:hypothetical protein [Candidatus Uhrbacteria bacterium]
MDPSDVEGVIVVIDPMHDRLITRRGAEKIQRDYLRERLEQSLRVDSWTVVVVAALTEVCRINEFVVLQPGTVIGIGVLQRLLLGGVRVVGTHSYLALDSIGDMSWNQYLFDALFDRIQNISQSTDDWCDDLEEGNDLLLL